MTNLHKKKCLPCHGDIVKFGDVKIKEYLTKIDDWQLKKNFLVKEFKFKNFANTLEFVNKIGAIAEDENHHPNIEFTWGYLKISIQTHKINGICENDFILAAKIDQLTT